MLFNFLCIFFLLEQCKVLIHLGDDFFFFSIDKFTSLEWKKPVVTNSRHKTQRAYQHIYINFYDFAVPHMIWFWLHLQWSDAELMRQFPRFASLFQCSVSSWRKWVIRHQKIDDLSLCWWTDCMITWDSSWLPLASIWWSEMWQTDRWTDRPVGGWAVL